MAGGQPSARPLQHALVQARWALLGERVVVADRCQQQTAGVKHCLHGTERLDQVLVARQVRQGVVEARHKREARRGPREEACRMAGACYKETTK